MKTSRFFLIVTIVAFCTAFSSVKSMIPQITPIKAATSLLIQASKGNEHARWLLQFYQEELLAEGFKELVGLSLPLANFPAQNLFNLLVWLDLYNINLSKRQLDNSR
jgi:hypothetical protein